SALSFRVWVGARSGRYAIQAAASTNVDGPRPSFRERLIIRNADKAEPWGVCRTRCGCADLQPQAGHSLLIEIPRLWRPVHHMADNRKASLQGNSAEAFHFQYSCN